MYVKVTIFFYPYITDFGVREGVTEKNMRFEHIFCHNLQTFTHLEPLFYIGCNVVTKTNDCVFSGMLTGKYKRGQKPQPTAGRIGIVAQDESKAMQIAPAWSQYDNNAEYWKLVEGMGRIAKEKGSHLIYPFNLSAYNYCN